MTLFTVAASRIVERWLRFQRSGAATHRVRLERERLLVCMGDNGPSIPPDEQEGVLDPFRRIEGFDTRRKGGSGLGLALARQRVGLTGGRAWLDSGTRLGSAFFFTLPAKTLSGDA